MQLNENSNVSSYRPYGSLQPAAPNSEEERRYPLKWSICYNGQPYIALYGKKKAHDLLYRLSQSFDGLSVMPIEPASEADDPRQSEITVEKTEWTLHHFGEYQANWLRNG